MISSFSQKAPRTGLNTSLLLQKRHLGLLPENSYCRYVLYHTAVHTCIQGHRAVPLLSHACFNTRSCNILQKITPLKQRLTLMLISSVCVEWGFFGAVPVTNNDDNHFWRGFQNSHKKRKQKHPKTWINNKILCCTTVCNSSINYLYSAYWQTFIWINRHIHFVR